jgi:hypothetical protein
MYYQLRHVAAKLRQDEAMIRSMMPNLSESDPEPLTIYENDRTNMRKTLTFTLADVEAN